MAKKKPPKQKPPAKAKKPSIEYFLLDYKEIFSPEKRTPRLFTDETEATKAAEAWVGKKDNRSATLSKFNAKGVLTSSSIYGVVSKRDFEWSDETDY